MGIKNFWEEITTMKETKEEKLEKEAQRIEAYYRRLRQDRLYKRNRKKSVKFRF